MPRTHLPGASTLRNRNRITNKTRLRIVKGNVDVEDIFIPDEDEEKHRLTNLVAGVDAEDANEHHLQQVLSAAHRSQVHKKTEDKSAAYIPTPDSTGVVRNAEEYYPPGRWCDPATYVYTSTTVEEAVSSGIAGGFTYYMDERDKEWLDKNNEEARGEGTSAQGAVSASGTRTSSRSAKAKGKEPDIAHPTAISEDEFELVMGIFEKVTHEKTEFLHHSLETGMPFPAFSDYQDVFSAPLTPAMFSSYTVPSWIPPPTALVRIARTVYPYWKERRQERAGHRIIPTLNFDESDTLNESYICFRRREIKAVRKTRQSQVTFSDKLVRLQGEFSYPLELARLVLQRETTKKENAQQGQQLWEKRMALADLKRKFPVFSDKADEELLVDKERPKRPEPLRIAPRQTRPVEPLQPIPQIVIKPRERIAQVKGQIETTLAKQKEADRSWEDVIDNPYQTPYSPYASKLFQYIPPSAESPSDSSSISDKTSESDDEPPAKVARSARAVRLRYGRGGRLVLDRRNAAPRRPVSKAARSSLFGTGDEGMDVDEQDPEETERLRRLEEKWRFDSDDGPPCGPGGPDEQDRELVDDFDPKYLRYSMTLFSDLDHMNLTTDTKLLLPTASGHQTPVVPYRLGMQLQPLLRRDASGQLRPIHPLTGQWMFTGPPNHPAFQALAAGTPVAMQHQLKKMPPPNTIPHMRISSNGGMRPPSVPASAVGVASTTPQHPLPTSTPMPQPTTNGVGARPAIAMPHVDLVKPAEPTVNGSTESAAAPAEQPQQSADVVMNGVEVPVRPKSQNQTPVALSVPANGYHLTPMATATPTPGVYAHLQPGQRPAINMAKFDVKTAFANMSPQEIAALQVRAAATNRNIIAAANGNMQMANGNVNMNVNLKLPAQAGMRWAMTPHVPHSPSPLPNIAQSQSPPRLPMTPY